MTWMNKALALDLLAILIGAGQSAYDKIKSAPDGEWPPAVEKPADESAAPQAPDDPPAAAEAPKPNTPPAAAPQQQETPAPNPDEQLVEAKNLLQSIVASGNREWVTGTLLPRFGVAKLSDVPVDKLPELIKAAEKKKQEVGQ